MFIIIPALTQNKGPMGESPSQIRTEILEIMREYNMHLVPSPEMDELDLSCFYLAFDSEHKKYLGAAGYKILPDNVGKTTLLSVSSLCTRSGVGYALQQARVEKMKTLGVTHIITNADRPESIAWYKKQGYEEIGKLPKIHSFGLDTVDHWTTLRLDINSSNLPPRVLGSSPSK